MNYDDFDEVKITPHSIEAEQAILGGLLVNCDLWDSISDLVKPEHFYKKGHQLIFEAIGYLINKDGGSDILMVGERLKEIEVDDEVGGMPYLATMAQDYAAISNIRAYAAIVYDRAVLRGVIGATNSIADVAFNPKGKSASEVLQIAESEIFKLAETGSANKGPRGVIDVLKSTLSTIDKYSKTEDGITGLRTGFDKLDEMTSGFQNGDMIVVAGRPSMGKTTIAMNICEKAAIMSGKPILIFSLEMPEEHLMMRMLSSVGSVPLSNIRKGQLNNLENRQLAAAFQSLIKTKIFIDDEGSLSPSEMRSRARKMQREQGKLGLIMIDYLQLMSIAGESNRVNEVSEISRSIKAMARELDVPVVVLSQLSRELEKRPNKRPIMSDLRDSGAIEQDADLICFIYRDVVYNKDTLTPTSAELIIAKQRNGPIGVVDLDFQGAYSRFRTPPSMSDKLSESFV